MKPGWLLDIDGVINATGLFDFKTRWPHDDWIVTRLGPDGPEGQEYPFRTSSAVRDFITEMHSAGVDIRWHTTWQEGAQVAANYLNLPVFPILNAPEYRDRRYNRWDSNRSMGWWKEPAVKRLLIEDDRPWIWTDDQIDDLVPYGNEELKTPFQPYEEAAFVVGERIPGNIATANHLFISPEEEYGLSPTHIALIRGFVNNCL